MRTAAVGRRSALGKRVSGSLPCSKPADVCGGGCEEWFLIVIPRCAVFSRAPRTTPRSPRTEDGRWRCKPLGTRPSHAYTAFRWTFARRLLTFCSTLLIPPGVIALANERCSHEKVDAADPGSRHVCAGRKRIPC